MFIALNNELIRCLNIRNIIFKILILEYHNYLKLKLSNQIPTSFSSLLLAGEMILASESLYDLYKVRFFIEDLK